MTLDQAIEFFSALEGGNVVSVSFGANYQWSEEGAIINRPLGYPLTNELLNTLKNHPEIVAELKAAVSARIIEDLEAEEAAAQKKVDDARRDLGLTP